MTLPEKIREVMQWRGVTQKELSERTGIVYSTLNGYLCGRNQIPLDAVKLMAEKLGVSWILMLNGEPLPADDKELTMEERETVARYRQLTREQRESITQNMEFFIRQNREHMK